MFQQILSYEKTPTLCYAVVAFEGLRIALKDLQEREPNAEFIIEAGLEKLEDYHQHALAIPAYTLSAGEYSFYDAE